jgi:hypothetical protein
LAGVYVVRIGREVIADASCTLPRKEGRDPEELKKARDLAAHKLKNDIKPMSLSFPYKRIF